MTAMKTSLKHATEGILSLNLKDMQADAGPQTVYKRDR